MGECVEGATLDERTIADGVCDAQQSRRCGAMCVAKVLDERPIAGIEGGRTMS
jgi:hypothetical protein